MIDKPERPWPHPTGLRQVRADYELGYFSNGLIAFIFSATGPLAIVLSVGSQGALSEAELSSWVFGIEVEPVSEFLRDFRESAWLRTGD